MIPHGVEVFVGLDTIDLRWGFERLTGVVAERLGREVRSRALFVFFGRRRTALKVLYFDGSGLCILYKRLDAGTFRPLPELVPGQRSVRMSEGELETLLSGVDLELPVARRRRPVHH